MEIGVYGSDPAFVGYTTDSIAFEFGGASLVASRAVVENTVELFGVEGYDGLIDFTTLKDSIFCVDYEDEVVRFYSQEELSKEVADSSYLMLNMELIDSLYVPVYAETRFLDESPKVIGFGVMMDIGDPNFLTLHLSDVNREDKFLINGLDYTLSGIGYGQNVGLSVFSARDVLLNGFSAGKQPVYILWQDDDNYIPYGTAGNAMLQYYDIIVDMPARQQYCRRNTKVIEEQEFPWLNGYVISPHSDGNYIVAGQSSKGVGLQYGDIILGLTDEKIDKYGGTEGLTYTLSVLRDGKKIRVKQKNYTKSELWK